MCSPFDWCHFYWPWVRPNHPKVESSRFLGRIVRPHRSTTYVDVAYCYGTSSVVCRSVCLSVCLSGTVVKKMAGWTDRDAVCFVSSGELKESCLTWGPRCTMGRDIFRQKGAAHYKVWGPSGLSCAKTAAPIKMPFRMLSRVVPWNHVLDESADDPTGRGILGGVYGPLWSIRFSGLWVKGEMRKNVGPILMIIRRITCFHAVVPFGDRSKAASIYGGIIPPKDLHFGALAWCSNKSVMADGRRFDNISKNRHMSGMVWPIGTKFCTITYTDPLNRTDT